jgi:hypothetical protein
MNILFNKKIFIPAIIVILLIIAGLFIKLTLLDKSHLLIDYLPKETEFWFWQNKGGFNQKLSTILTQLGTDFNIIKLLQNQKDEIVIYRQNGRWYKIEAGDLDKARISRRGGELWEVLFKGRENVIGFLHQDYIQDRLGEFNAVLKPGSYYFVLEEKPESLVFSLVEKEKVFTPIKLRVSEAPTLPLGIIMAVKLDNAKLLSSILEILKKNIKESIAFDYPVIISQELPDGTWIKEKVVKPELFSWQEVLPDIYQLGLDKAVVDRYQIADQLKDVKVDLEYYQDDQSIVFGLQVADFPEGFGDEPDSFFYLNLRDNAAISLVDILGKSKSLSWLQDLGFQSMIIYEKDGTIDGELRF